MQFVLRVVKVTKTKVVRAGLEQLGAWSSGSLAAAVPPQAIPEPSALSEKPCYTD